MTFFYLSQTVKQLNEQLSDPILPVPDSTVVVVLGLVQMAAVLGDQAAVDVHMDGLHKVVKIRGGLEAFQYDTKLYLKLSRYEFSSTLLVT